MGERDDASEELVSAAGELEDEGRYRVELHEDDDVNVLSKRESGGGSGEVKS